MTPNLDDLIHGYLDDTLSESQEADLNDRIKANPADARRFARLARLHDRLRDDMVAIGADRPSGASRPPSRAWRRVALSGALMTVASLIIAAAWWIVPARPGAATELEKLITTSSSTGDRSYLIRNLDPTPELAEERRPPIDGATLHVRGSDQYVLIRRFPDGRRFVTGSDGERSWSSPPDGAVRVSHDPLRFRGPVPGNQHGIPFVDLRSDLLQLREAYDLTLLDPRQDGWQGLVARKKSREFRGPRRVELWYDPRTRVIHQMVFDGLPRGRGGPESVAVDLIDQKPLTPDFFQHETHHAPGRRVIEEE